MSDDLLAKKAAKAAYDREYRAKNREKIAAAKKIWGQSEAKKTYDKNWVKENLERSRAIKAAWKVRNPNADREYREKNAERCHETRLRYYERNRATALVRAKEWAAENADYVKARSAAAYAANPEPQKFAARMWKKENPEKARAADTAWRRNNPLKVKLHKALRRSRVRLATPIWADIGDIKAVYQEAVYMQLHVDHIIPLKHPLVCGLHVWDNLQLLSRSDNARKGNKFNPETYRGG